MKMLDTLITSKTRKKLLLKFFLNSTSHAYLRNLEQELDESPNALRIELAKFEKANMLTSKYEGNKKVYYTNTKHPLYQDIRNIMMKTVGLDQIIDKVIDKMGDLKKVYVTGNFARGVDGDIIDLLFIGDKVNSSYLMNLVEKTEKLIDRRIRYIVLCAAEEKNYLKNDKQDILLLWKT